MILRITIENLRSFNNETEISFVAGKSIAHEEHVCRAKKCDDISVLKTGVIYGANASGKSNIIKAVAILQQIALSSVPRTSVEPFKLNSQDTRPSKVELEFKVGEHFFAYGVCFTIKGIVEEWLYKFNNCRDQEIFSRKVTSEGNEITFGEIEGDAEVAQLLKFIGKSTPTKDSFLSEYVKRNGDGLPLINEVYRWMKGSLKIVFPGSRYKGITIHAEKDKDFAEATRTLLGYFNTGIVDIRRMRVNKEEVNLPKELIGDLLGDAEPNKKFAIASSEDIFFFETDSEGTTTIYKQSTVHKTKSGQEVSFEMKEESDGSIRLLDFIPMLIDLRLNNSVYLVDEIDRSLHPMLSQKLLEYYFKHLSEDRNTQLIVSTHESNLLNLDLLRADEVWFVEKGFEGESHLTSLAEYKPQEDVRKGYLQGRYGAIPFFAPISSLKW